MANNPRVSELLERWEASRRRGGAAPPEELCRDCPELLEALVEQIHALGSPPTDSSGTATAPTPVTATPSRAEVERAFAAAGYAVVRELGRGGMGVVYHAVDTRRQRPVALKTLQQVNPTALVRFKHEFRALADVTHPNLVPLFELISDGRTWFFTMELVRGADFLGYVRAGDVPPHDGRLRAVLRQLVEGVGALHEAGQLHRDLKPSNVLVTAEGRVVVLDFGLTADLERDGYQGPGEHDVVGTAAYMAPEQAMGLPLSPASDWYSVGVMLYEALTGERPHRGSRLQVLRDKQHLDPPPPRSLAPDIPEDLEALCVALLRRRPEERPGRADILRQLQPAPVAPPPVTPATPAMPPARVAFVGRSAHLAALEDAFRASQDGRAVTVYVRGRSGLGKSALVHRFLAGLHERGAVVFAGRCYERESVPYKALDSLIDALGQYVRRLPPDEVLALVPPDMPALARVFPVLRRLREPEAGRPAEAPDQQELRRRAFAALRELLTRLGARRPLVLFIDDLQWGDPDSALLLSELLRPPDPPVLLLIGSFRSEDAAASPALRALFEPRGPADAAAERRELAVEALTEAETRELAGRLLAGAAEGAARAESVARESEGNPLFLQELARSCRPAAAAGAPPGGTVTLDEALWGRIRALPEPARRLVEVLAVAGRPIAQATAAHAAELAGQDQALLGLLRSGHLVRGSGPGELDSIETYHDRIRESVVAHLGPEVLADHHRRLAVTLEAAGNTDPETLAIHFLGAGASDRAGHYYALAAAGAAQALAFDRSATLYRRALELRPVGAADESALRARLGDALANAGRGAEAAREYQTVAAAAPPPEALELHRRAAYQYLISGHFDAGRRALDAVLGAVGLHLPATPLRSAWSLLWRRGWLRLRGLRFRERTALAPAERARLDICWSASIGLGVIDIIRAADFQTRCLLLALRAGDPFHVARSLAIEAIFTAAGGGRTRRRTAALLAAADRLAGRLADPYIDGVVTMAHGACAFLEGRFPAALTALVRADEIFRSQCTGVAWEIDTSLTHRVVTMSLAGRVGELSRLGPQRLREAQGRGDLYAATNLSAFVLPQVRLAADDPGGAAAVVTAAMAQWSQGGFHLQHLFALLSETDIDLYRGAAAAAWARIEERWPAYLGSQLDRVQVCQFQARFARARAALAAVDATDPRPYRAAAQREARTLQRAGMPWSRALAGLIRAGLYASERRAGAAGAALEGAIALLDECDGRLHAAAARWCLGRLRGGAAGRALQAAAEASMSAEGIRNPPRMAQTLVPLKDDG